MIAEGFAAAGLAALSLAAALQQDAASAITWEEVRFNPAPAEGDVILPLPCGGGMTFRRVTTGSTDEGGLLADQTVSMGEGRSATPHLDAQVTAQVAGGLAAEGERYYLMAKYEVTRRQFAAVVEGDCSDPGDPGDLPASEVTWFDAVRFTWAMNAWLREQAPGSLPDPAEGGLALVRLPTEPEWEFAARGGLAVSELDRAQPLHPMDGPIEEYVWFAGPASSSGDLQYVGSRKPNPLGLHDMLGHVQEIMLEPFTLRRGSRDHGLRGGYVLRGGGVSTRREAVSAASRTERGYFRADGAPDTAADVGFRPMISATAVRSVAQNDALAAAFRAIEERRAEFDSPIQALRALREQGMDALDPEALQRLEMEVRNIESELETAADLAAERADLALESLLFSGALLQSSLLKTKEAADRHFAAMQSSSETVRAIAEPNFQRESQEFESLRSGHADLVRRIAMEYDQRARRRAVDRLTLTLTTQGQDRLAQHAVDFDNLAHAYAITGGLNGCDLARRAAGDADWYDC